MNLVDVVIGGEPARAVRAPGPGPTVVLLHGASGNARTWAPILPHFAWADVWAPELPGRAGAGEARSDVAALARWLSAWLAEIGPPALVVGHSLGGAVSLRLALDDASPLAGLILVSTAARLKVAPPILAAAAASSDEAPLDLSLAFGPRADPALVTAYREAQRGVPREASVADWAACDGFDVRSELGPISTPTLVLWGSEDRFTPARFQPDLAVALGAGMREMEGAGHMLPWERPAAVAEATRSLAGPPSPFARQRR